jgi:hypothetical protein
LHGLGEYAAECTGGDEHPWGDNLDWFCCTGCPYHDITGAVRWALVEWTSADLLSDIHIFIASLRNGFAFIARKILLFVMSHLQARVVESASDEATNFWIRLGIDSEMLDIIISVDLHWDGVALWFNAGALSEFDSINQVTSIIFFLFRFSDFQTRVGCSQESQSIPY